MLLVNARRPWRTDWLTFGLSDDGWATAGTVAPGVFLGSIALADEIGPPCGE
jgi:hypothetical protein